MQNIGNTLISDSLPLDNGTPGLDLTNLGEQALFVVGDVHGQHDALVDTLNAFGKIKTPTGVTRHLVFLGDLIDRGPRSFDCLNITLSDDVAERAKADAVTRLLGNHELLFLDTLRHALNGDATTLRSAET